jgi:formylglycine-generating enzyme
LRWNQPGFAQTENHPVSVVSCLDAVAFCEWLSQHEQAVYRLPTEEEWEYACRANTTGIRHCDSESMPGFDWFGVNSGHRAHPVGQKKPNPFGLHDMYGNVREWCADWYDETLYQRRVNDSAAIAVPGSTPARSIRGGSFMDLRPFMRTSMRLFNAQHNRYTNIGFRVVREEGGAIKDM